MSQCPKCGAPMLAAGEGSVCGPCLLALGLEASETKAAVGTCDLGSLLRRRIEPLGVKFHEFGEYELVEELARGGMGVVFRARQVSLNRTVALKLIAAGHLASAEQVRRFRTEAETAAGLEHPHIVPIYEIGEHDGQHYFTMKLVEGGSLALKFSDRGCRISQPEAASLMASLARAVHFAHQRGILHRDLKPGNILLDERGEPHITDFGLAKALTEGADLTQTMAVLGTPHYMSPEQARGQTRGLTTASDIYSLGAILYELLTGRPPFTGGTLIEVLRRVTQEEPVRPSLARPPGRMRDRQGEVQLDRDLETICLKCLEKDPARRYGSAAALAEDLEKWLCHEPIVARPATTSERVVKWTRRNPALASAVAATVLVGLAGIVGVLTQLQRARARELEARRQLYADHVNLASQAWEGGDLVRARALLDAVRPRTGEKTDLRGFEWRHLWRICRDESRCTITNIEAAVPVPTFFDDQRLVPEADDGGVRAAVFWFDDQLLVAGRKDIRTADFDGRQGEALITEPDGIQDIQLSPARSNLLAVVTLAKSIKLWDLSSGRPLVTNTPQTRPWSHIRAVTFSDDGKWLAAAAGGVEMWDLNAPQSAPLVLDRYDAGSAIGVTFSRDSKRIITCGAENAIRVWQTATGLQDGPPLEGHTSYVLAIVVSPDGRLLASAANDGRIIVWDLTTRKELFQFPEQRAGILYLAFSPDGRWLASGSHDRTTRIWDMERRGPSIILRGHEGAVRSVAFSPGGEFLLSVGRTDAQTAATADGTRRYLRTWNAKLWDATSAHRQNVLTSHEGYIINVAFSSDSRSLASADYLGVAKLSDVPSQRLVATLDGHTKQICVRFDPKGRVLATGGLDRLIRIWRPGYENPVASLTNEAGVITLAFSADGQTLASGGWAIRGETGLRSRVVLWDTRTFQQIGAIEGHWGAVWSLAFAPEGPQLAIGSLDGTVTLWDTSTRQCVHSWKAHSQFVCSLAFSPDGARLASGGADAKIALYDLTSSDGGIESVLRGHTHWVFSLAFAPDGRTLASAGLDGNPKLWNLATREVALSLKSTGGPITSVAFAPDGNLLATGGADGVVRLWPAAPLAEADSVTRVSTSSEPWLPDK